MVVRVIKQEGVVPGIAVNFGVGDAPPVVQQGKDDLARA